MFLADDVAVLALPPKPRHLRQRLFHNGRGIHEHFDADLCRMGQPTGEPLERAFDDIMIVASLRIDRYPRLCVIARKRHWIMRRRVAHPQHDHGLYFGP